MKVEPIRTPGREGLLPYRDMLLRFLSITGEDLTIYAGHLNRPHKALVAKNLAAACEEVASGARGPTDGSLQARQREGKRVARRVLC
jgi:hypothetical protein